MNPTITPNNAPQPTPAPVVATAPQSNKVGQNAYETVMLIFGALTIFSLVTNNAWLVKISVMVFLGVALISIIKSLNKSRIENQRAQSSFTQANTTLTKKPMTVLRLLGIILFILVGIPVISYACIIAFIIFLFIAGGGKGT